MIGTIRRHQTWLWVVIIALTVVSFVIFGPTNTKIGNALSRGSGSYGYLAGKAISRTELNNAQKEVLLGYFLSHNGEWPKVEGPELTREAYWRLLLIQRQKDYGIQISTEAAATLARRILGPNSGALDEFVDKVLKQVGMDADDFDRYLHHELGQEQLIALAGLSGKLVTPQEAETLYKLEHQDTDASIVLFSASNYLSQVTVTPDDISKFYTNQMANYRQPEQVQVSYVKFSLASFTNAALAKITNLNEILDVNIKRLGTNMYKGAATLEESRAKMRSDIVRQAAIAQARQAAYEFAQLLENEPTNNLPRVTAFDKIAASKALPVQVTAPFEREYGPQDISVAPDFTRKAFSLTSDEPFAGPIIPDDVHPAVDGVYVIALKDRQLSRTPALKEIEARVTSDYRFARAVQMAQETAMRFHAAATNEMAPPMNKPFSDICAENMIKSKSLPLFSVSSRGLTPEIDEKVSFNMVKQIAFSTPAGQVGPVAPARDGAFVLYINKTLPVDQAKLKKELPEFLAGIRQARQGDAFQQWFNAQVRRDPEFMQTVNQLNQEIQSRNTRRPSS